MALRVLALVLGVAALVAGAVAVFVSSNETGTGALLVAGVALVGFALLGDRIDSIEGAGVKVLLRKADSKFAQADLAERAGRPEDATRLRTEGHQLLSAVHSLGSEYERVRGTHESGAQRTQLMEALMSQGRALAPQLAGPEQVQSIADVLARSTFDGHDRRWFADDIRSRLSLH
jgi:hypothetical protein